MSQKHHSKHPWRKAYWDPLEEQKRKQNIAAAKHRAEDIEHEIRHERTNRPGISADGEKKNAK